MYKEYECVEDSGRKHSICKNELEDKPSRSMIPSIVIL